MAAMPVPSAYLTKAESAGPILGAIQRAGVPDRFTHEFLQKQLGFTSSADRPVLSVLKALRFLDDSGVPTERYRQYKDPSQARRVMAEAMREAYADIFAADQRADRLSGAQLRGMFGRISGKGESVTQKMASTFAALAALADFEAVPGERDADESATRQGEEDLAPSANGGTTGVLSLRHEVHVHLPSSTDIAVYNAIFRSLRENLGI
jgi:hypothetical protein